MRLTGAGDPAWHGDLIAPGDLAGFCAPRSVDGRIEGRIALCSYAERNPRNHDRFFALFNSAGALSGGCGFAQPAAQATSTAMPMESGLGDGDDFARSNAHPYP